MRVELIDRRTTDTQFGGEAPRRCRVVVSNETDACNFYRRWDNKGWYFYDREGRHNYPKLKAAIAAWRLTR